MIDHYASTKALSVYNVLIAEKSTALPTGHILAKLQRDFLPRYEACDVSQGIEFLLERNLVSHEADVVSATHVRGPRRPVALRRCDDDANLELDL